MYSAIRLRFTTCVLSQGSRRREAVPGRGEDSPEEADLRSVPAAVVPRIDLEADRHIDLAEVPHTDRAEGRRIDLAEVRRTDRVLGHHTALVEGRRHSLREDLVGSRMCMVPAGEVAHCSLQEVLMA